MAEEETQPTVRSSPYSAPIHIHGSSIITLTNPKNELHHLELALRNSITDEKGDAIPLGDPLLNDKGIARVLSLVGSLLNQNTSFANYQDREVMGIIDEIGDTVRVMLMNNRLPFDIHDGYARSEIRVACTNHAFTTLTRGRKGDDKRFLGRAIQEIRTVAGEDSGRKKRGVMGALMDNWKKGG